MSKEFKNIEIVPYNSIWVEQFKIEAREIEKVLGEQCLNVYHIGSTSIEGLCSKPKIDIVVEVRGYPKETISKLATIGFVYRGEFNIPMHYGFNKRGSINVNLHVYQENHPEIALNLIFRDYLRSHPQIKEEYAALKRSLLESKSSFEKNDSMFTGYNLGKDAFIRNVLKLAGFDRLRFLRCVHYEEWKVAKQMRQHYFFDKAGRKDPYEWTFNHADHAHFVLCKGIDIIGYAHIQLWKDFRAAIRIIVIEEGERHDGYGKQFLIWIETWLKEQGYQSIHTEASPDAAPFYKKMGYILMPFNDPDGYEKGAKDIEMGKQL